MPRISILMGVYNCAETVAASIESIQAQTFPDWEFIICDDGSKDQTCQIVADYAKNDPRIRLIRNEQNRGLSYTLNHCLQYAQGEFCARMDGDDLCQPTRFEKQVEFLQTHPEFAFVSTRMTRFDENGVYQIPEPMDSYSPTARDFVRGSPFCHAPVMMRTSAYRAVDGYRDLDRTRGVEDYDLWFRLYAAGLRGYVLQEPLYSMFDGRDAAKRRTFRRRWNEAWVRWQGYWALHIPFYKRVYVLKPIIIGLIPQWLYRRIR